MIKYDLTKNSREISGRNLDEIHEGCTLEQINQEPEILKSFEVPEEALKTLKKYKSEISKLSGGAGTVYSVTEYYIQSNEYDKNEVWIGGGDIWDFSKMPKIK